MSSAGKRSRSSVKSHVGKPSAKKRSKSMSATKVRRSGKLAAARMVANAATMGFLGIEKKFYDTAKADTAIAANTDLTGGEYDPSSTSMLSTPTQGDGEQQRDGKRIVIDSVIIKGHVVLPATEAAADPYEATKVFVAIVLDTQTNAAQMSSEDCFKSLAASSRMNCEPLKNLLSGSRFRILKSQGFDVTPNTLTGTITTGPYAHYGVQREFDWYIPFKGGLPVNFNAGTTASVANVVDNSVHVIAFATATGAYLGYNARIRFQG